MVGAYIDWLVAI